MYPSQVEAILQIKQFFKSHNKSFIYTNQKKNQVECTLIEDGIKVSCLTDSGYKDFLPWGVFWITVDLLLKNKGTAMRGQAHAGYRLGTEQLPLNSIEGNIASVIYGKAEGESVYSRISPVAHILIASGVCIDKKGDLELSHLAK